MNEKEFNEWENNIGFISLRTQLNNIYDEMDQCEDSLSFETLLNNNSDILATTDSLVVPKIESIVYSSLINRDGIYYVGSTLHKIQGTKLAVSLTGDSEAIENALNPIKKKSQSTNATSDIFIMDYLTDNTTITTKSGSLSSSLEDWETAHDRKIHLKMLVTNACGWRVHFRDALPYYVETSNVTTIEVTARNYKKKKWSKKYRVYSTHGYLKDLSYKVRDGYTDYTGSLSYYKSPERVKVVIYKKTLWSKHETWPVYDFPNDSPSRPTIISAHAEATNDGLQQNWAIINK